MKEPKARETPQESSRGTPRSLAHPRRPPEGASSAGKELGGFSCGRFKSVGLGVGRSVACVFNRYRMCGFGWRKLHI